MSRQSRDTSNTRREAGGAIIVRSFVTLRPPSTPQNRTSNRARPRCACWELPRRNLCSLSPRTLLRDVLDAVEPPAAREKGERVRVSGITDGELGRGVLGRVAVGPTNECKHAAPQIQALTGVFAAHVVIQSCHNDGVVLGWLQSTGLVLCSAVGVYVFGPKWNASDGGRGRMPASSST